jgi:predicted dinucleotide-binding enzyme
LVGQALASKLLSIGHEVMMGSREAANPVASAWAARSGGTAMTGTFVDAANFGELLFNCVHGASSLEALSMVGEQRLTNKVIVDVANILPPGETHGKSLGEKIQEAFPSARVVKALNTIYLELMVDPEKIGGSHTIFMSGNDLSAKKMVKEMLEAFSWKDVLDLGDIGTARAAEAYLSLWFAIAKSLNTPYFNIKVIRQ